MQLSHPERNRLTCPGHNGLLFRLATTLGQPASHETLSSFVGSGSDRWSGAERPVHPAGQRN
jgi:hypothetical protein